MAEIRLSGVTKRFGDVVAVEALDLTAADGEFLVLLGPSGCGKSTALRMIAGLEDPTEGEVAIGDRVVTDVAPKDRDVAMVFQSYALYPHKSVRANIEMPLKPRRVPKEERAAQVAEAARMLGLEDLLDRKPRELSGGQRQRVALARAIVRRPAAFLMDEPLSNLDAKLRIQTRAELVELHRRLGTTVVYVTHDQVEAMTMADRVAVMDAGRLQQVGPPQEVYDRPANAFVARFIGSPPMNLLPATAGEGAVHVGGGTLPAPPGLAGAGPVTVGVRPEHLRDAGTSEPALEVALRVVESLGHERLLVCDTADGDPVIVRRPADAEVPDDGTTLRLTADAANVHVFDADSGERRA
ncbi:MAG TPA: sn-glycerol-3-phosphate ABC transporter ATP-binding protein UgpC [Acidimicrobiales bacterium]|nr:sn-glycerol-3-phosphate ABC transporter ATP-binding protein UgpC [Acidimicrobiales bacterium]